MPTDIGTLSAPFFGGSQGFQSNPAYYAYGNNPYGGNASFSGGLAATTPRENEFFSQYPYNVSYPYGSPAGATAAPEGVFSGGRTSAFFGPSGVPYDELSPGDRNYHRTVDAYNQQRQFSDLAYGQFRNVVGQQRQEIERGFNDAFDYTERQGETARSRALDREDQLASELSSRSGGFDAQYAYNRRGLADATTRQLSAIDEGIGRLYSDLSLSRTSATTNVLGSLGQSYLAQADDYLTFLQQERSLLAGQQAQVGSQKDYSGLYNLLGSVTQGISYIAGNKG